MADLNKIGDARLAARVIEAYAEGIDAFSDQDCRGLDIDGQHCHVLQAVLGKGKEGAVTQDERKRLHETGFADEFVYELARDTWWNPLHSRVRWLADHAVKKWWRIDYSDEDRAAMLSEIGAIGMDVSEGLRAIVNAIRDESALVREAAAAALPLALPAFAHNIGAVFGPRDSTAEEFNGIGHAVAPAFAAILKHPDKDVRRMAALVLRRDMGRDAKYAVSALIEALADPDLQVRYLSAETLGNLGPDGKRAVPALIAALKDPAEEVRRASAEALGNVGPDAKEAIPALGEALRGTFTMPSNDYAGKALFKIDEGTVTMIVEALKEKDWDKRRPAWRALLDLGERAVPWLAAALGDEDGVLRANAAQLLGHIGKESYPAIPFLEQMRDSDPDYNCRTEAKWAVEKIEKKIR